MKHKNAKGG